MGIPRYFKTILQKYPTIAIPAGDMDMDFLFFDFNGVVYICDRNVQKRGLKYTPSKKKEYEDAVITEVLAYVEELVCEVVKPKKLLYIALDGPPPRAKMNQQRWRRFKSILHERLYKEAQDKYGVSKEDHWPANHNISPGTEFMERLSNALQNAIKNKLFNRHSATMRTVLSDASVPGEGEHKIIPYLRKIKASPSAKYCIYGMDGDLLVLALVTGKDNIYILREPDVQQGVDAKLAARFEGVPLIYVIMNEFRDRFVEDYGLEGYDYKRILYDYMVLTALSGNDFLPPLPGMLIREQGLERSLKIYTEIMSSTPDHRHLVDKSGSKYILNMEFFRAILQELGKQEWNNLKILQERYRTQKYKDKLDPDESEYKRYIARLDNALFSQVENPLHEQYAERMDVIDYLSPKDIWRAQYYGHFVGIDPKETREYDQTIRQMSLEYMKAIIFVIRYYTEGVPSWSWIYPYRCSPFVSDLQRSVHNIKNANGYFKFDMGRPYGPLEQLLMIMPPQASHLLPRKLGHLMTDISSPIIDLYPTEFELDVVHGKKLIYSEPILPYQDPKRITDLSDPIIKKLPIKERVRNKISTQPLKFNFDPKNTNDKNTIEFKGGKKTTSKPKKKGKK